MHQRKSSVPFRRLPLVILPPLSLPFPSPALVTRKSKRSSLLLPDSVFGVGGISFAFTVAVSNGDLVHDYRTIVGKIRTYRTANPSARYFRTHKHLETTHLAEKLFLHKKKKVEEFSISICLSTTFICFLPFRLRHLIHWNVLNCQSARVQSR